MFRGFSKVTLDAKGRLAIPARHRERIVTRSEGQLVVTLNTAHCLLIYTLPDWEEIERKLTRLPSFNKDATRLRGLMLAHATDLQLDGHGRVLLPKELRAYAGLERQAFLIGQGNTLQLWDEKRWDKQRAEWLADDGGDGTDLPEELRSLSL
ncbi:MAG TPA: division/cell wall cluster transcriptional repressor MraZ [Gammaproteobacteria bacterium]